MSKLYHLHHKLYVIEDFNDLVYVFFILLLLPSCNIVIIIIHHYVRLIALELMLVVILQFRV